MLSACCFTVSPTTSSTCLLVSLVATFVDALSTNRNAAPSVVQDRRASAKQLVAFAFTWPAGGLFKISSKPSATPLRLSRVFDNTRSQGPRRSHFEKRFVRSKQWLDPEADRLFR